MKEHPILFSTDMVKAILEGRKTQTRRVPKYVPFCCSTDELKRQLIAECPYGQVGDHLWIRETWAGQDFAVCCENDKPNYKGKDGYFHPVIHKAGKENYAWGMSGEPKWHSGRFMFKTSARLWQEITDIRVQRIQEISPSDCRDEGVEPFLYTINYRKLWDKINGKKYPWESNPFVWCISFKKLD